MRLPLVYSDILFNIDTFITNKIRRIDLISNHCELIYCILSIILRIIRQINHCFHQSLSLKIVKTTSKTFRNVFQRRRFYRWFLKVYHLSSVTLFFFSYRGWWRWHSLWGISKCYRRSYGTLSKGLSNSALRKNAAPDMRRGIVAPILFLTCNHARNLLRCSKTWSSSRHYEPIGYTLLFNSFEILLENFLSQY